MNTFGHWILGYQILRVGILVPIFLNYGCKGLRQPQKHYHVRLVVANIVFFTLAIGNTLAMTFWPHYWLLWVELLPQYVQGIAIIYGAKLIGKEIKTIGLEEHYKSEDLINMNTCVWAFFLITLTISIGSLTIFASLDRDQGIEVYINVIARIITDAASFFVEWIVLFMLMRISSTQYNE